MLPYLCECNSFDCPLKVDLTLDEALSLKQNGQIVIVDGCKTDLLPGDTLVENRVDLNSVGYTVYKDSQQEL